MNTLRRCFVFAVWSLMIAVWIGGSTVEAQTAQPRWQAIDLGIPAGDAYSPRSVAVDEVNGLAYVFSADVPEIDGQTQSAVTVVKISTGQIVRRALVDLGDASSGGGKLWISQDGRRGYLLDIDGDALYTYTPSTDAIRLALTDVQDFAVSPDETRVVVRHINYTAVYTTNLRTRLWRVFNQPSKIAVSNTAILAEDRNESGEFLTAYHMENGIPRAQIAKPGWIDELTPGPGDSWFVGISATQPRIWRLDADLNVVAEADGLTGQSLFYDPIGERLIASGYRYGDRSQPATYWLWALTPDLVVESQQRWEDWRLPNAFAATPDALLAIREYDENDRLYLFDKATLAEDRRVALGVRLAQILLDPARGRLYAADNQDQVYSIDLISGEILGQWAGSAPLAVDEATGRLYVNRSVDRERVVVAIDGESGEIVAQFPQGGAPAPDPNRDLVYIADEGVTVYSRDGEQLGRLPSTFPAETTFIPNPYTVGIAINPVNGALIVFKNNGVPGSNNRNSAYLYPPPADTETIPADTPVILPSDNNVRTLVAFDRETGDFYLTYSGFSGVTAVYRIGADGALLDQVGGRTGHLHYHAPSGSLFVGERDLLAEFDAALDLTDFWLAPIDLDLAVLDDVTGQFYYQATWQGAVIVHQPLNGLARLRWDNPGGFYLSALPDQNVSSMTLAEHGSDDPRLFATLSDNSFFESDAGGEHWRQRYLGTVSSYGALMTEAADGTLYFASNGPYGGDGVFRSEDGGESWTLMNHGLTQLQAIEPMQTVDPNRLYLATAGQHLFRWERGMGHWTEIELPDGFYLSAGQFKLAPDGTLFLRDYDQLFRSDDHGERWLEVSTHTVSVDDWRFDADFADNERIYAIVNDYEARMRRLARSDDGGATWQFTAPGISISSVAPYTWLKLVPGDGALFIFESDLYALLRIYRSTDGGDTWDELADLDPVRGGEGARLAAGNVIWFIRGGRAASADLDTLVWQPIAGSADIPSTPTPTPAPTSTQMATPTPPAVCAVRLDNAETLAREAAPALGCPLGEPMATFLARQPFEDGTMIWRKDTAQIYVLAGDGDAQIFDDAWGESQPQDDPTLTPPPDRIQPVRGFGKIWREQLGGPQAEIGWATAVESGSDATVQAWSGGVLLTFGPGDLLAILDDGRWEGMTR